MFILPNGYQPLHSTGLLSKVTLGPRVVVSRHCGKNIYHCLSLHRLIIHHLTSRKMKLNVHAMNAFYPTTSTSTQKYNKLETYFLYWQEQDLIKSVMYMFNFLAHVAKSFRIKDCTGEWFIYNMRIYNGWCRFSSQGEDEKERIVHFLSDSGCGCYSGGIVIKPNLWVLVWGWWDF